jgi:transposase-like protein
MPGRRRITRADRERVVELYSTANSTRTIAVETGLSKTTILGIVKAAGLELRPRGHQRSF